MANRRVKGPTKQKKVTIPTHVWGLLEHYAGLETEAFEAMGGDTKYTVSDLLELSSEHFLRSQAEELGPIPGPDASASERRDFVAKLAAFNRRKLLEQLFQNTPATAAEPKKKS